MWASSHVLLAMQARHLLAAVCGPARTPDETAARVAHFYDALMFSPIVPAHHCAVGVGHDAGKLLKLAALLGMEFAQVC